MEPKKKGWADSEMRQLTRGQGQQTKGWILDGRNKCSFSFKSPDLGTKQRTLCKLRKGRRRRLCLFPLRWNMTRRGMKEIQST